MEGQVGERELVFGSTFSFQGPALAWRMSPGGQGPHVLVNLGPGPFLTLSGSHYPSPYYDY